MGVPEYLCPQTFCFNSIDYWRNASFSFGGYSEHTRYGFFPADDLSSGFFGCVEGPSLTSTSGPRAHWLHGCNPLPLREEKKKVKKGKTSRVLLLLYHLQQWGDKICPESRQRCQAIWPSTGLLDVVHNSNCGFICMLKLGLLRLCLSDKKCQVISI